MIKTVLFIVFCLAFRASASSANPLAQNGVVDLRGQDLNHPVELRGDWRFQWQNQGPFVPLAVPGSWYQDKRYDFSMFGYGRYQLQIIVDSTEQLALVLPEIWSAARVVLDGEEKISFGRPGSLTGGYQPETGIGFSVFTPKSQSFDLTIEVANYDIFLSGLATTPTIGRVAPMSRQRDQTMAADLIVIGSLLIMGLYHLCLFALRTEDPSTLWFAIVCFFVMFYTASINTVPLFTFWQPVPYSWRLRMLNFSWMVATHAFVWFAYYLFRPHFKKRMAQIASGIASVHHLMALTTPPIIFVNGSLAFQFFVVPILAYTCWIAWKTWCLGRRDTSRTFLFGVLVLVIAVINDMIAVYSGFAVPAIGGFGVMAFVLVQSYLLAQRFSMAFVQVRTSENKIRILSQNLQNTNENLEKTVEEKIRDIRSIMENIPIGIFIMAGNDGTIAHDHSFELKQIFDRDDLEGLNAASLLFTGSLLSEDEKSQAMSAIHASLNELDVNFDVNVSFFPTELHRRDAKGQLRIFDLTWDKIVNLQGVTEKILVTIRDTTELKRLQDRSMAYQEDLAIIGEILNVPAIRFNRFIRSAKERLNENENFLQKAEEASPNPNLLKLLFINIHTIKGAARSLYFKNMTQALHEVEQNYSAAKKTGSWELGRLRQDQLDLRLILERYDQVAREKLGRATTDRPQVDFPLDEVQQHYRRLHSVLEDHEIQSSSRQNLTAIIESISLRLQTPVNSIMKEICAFLPSLARDLHKENPMINLLDNGILATAEAEDILHQIFIHILRNSMDHGIETPEERQQKNKSPTPSISIHFEWQEDFITLIYWDDGRGLNLARLRLLATQNQLLDSSQLHDTGLVASLLFTSGISTAQTVTDISGRGVGMGAIRQYIEQKGGIISFLLGDHDRDAFVAFRLKIQLPSRLFAQSQGMNRVA